MSLRILTLSLLLSLGLAASNAEAELVPVEKSYELRAELVVLPSTRSGSLLLRACTECPVRSMQIDNETQFILGSQRVTLRQFRRFGVMEGLIMVFFEHDSQRVTRIRLPEEAVRNREDIHGRQDLDVDSDSDD